MNNHQSLRAGRKRAKEIISGHLLNDLLPGIAWKILDDVVQARIAAGHNMTGNTINSYAVGIYGAGRLEVICTPSIPGPLRRKLGGGEKFFAGDQRWDGDIQAHTFRAKVPTNGAREAERSIAFLRNYKSVSKGWEIVVCNGVEYASYQENEMNIDVLTGNFSYTQMVLPSMFKPMQN